LLLLFGIRLGSLPFARHELVGGPLSLGHPLLELAIRLPVHLLLTGATPLADLARMVRELLGFLSGLECPLLGLPGPLRSIPRTLHPDLDGVPANRSGVDHGCADLSPLIASSGGRGLDRL
jgi:hypothetical protein